MKLHWRFHNSSEVIKMDFKMENQLDFVSRKASSLVDGLYFMVLGVSEIRSLFLERSNEIWKNRGR